MEKEDAETYALIEWVGQDNIWLKVKDWSSPVRRNKHSDLRIIKSCCSKFAMGLITNKKKKNK